MSVNAESPISIEEQEQILQTIEMFEVITQANPNDCQSLEVLKEAYWKLNQTDKAIQVTRRLADTYYSLGQYASATLECEGILRKDPDNEEVAALLEELEAKVNHGSEEDSSFGASRHSRRMDRVLTEEERDANLMRTHSTIRPDGESDSVLDLADDGNDPMVKFFTQHRLVSPEYLQSALGRVRKKNAAIQANENPMVAQSLIGELCESNAADLDALLCGILDRTKLAYVPLEYYDVDRQIVKMLPESLTLGRLIVPFDLISRTVMVAMANPFDSLGKEAVQQLFDYNIQWHVASPAAITRSLCEVYRIDQKTLKK